MFTAPVLSYDVEVPHGVRRNGMHRDTVQDPVCGMRLERDDAVASSEWLGRRYHFCSSVCQRSFDADPGTHAAEGLETASARSVRVPLVGVACAAGDRLPLERGLLRVPGVLEAYVNPVDEAAYLTVDPARFRIQALEAAVERLGARGVVRGVRGARG